MDQIALQAPEVSCFRPCAIRPDGIHELIALQQAMVAGELSPERWQRDLVQIRCDMDEAVDASVLRYCLADLITRHDALRARLEWNDTGVGHQVIERAARVPLDILDVEGLPQAELEARICALLTAAWTEPFDVVQPPRLRAALIRLAPARHQLVITYQETELDEHAGKLLMGELLELYDCAVVKRTAKLPPAVSFYDYLNWLSANRDMAACHYWSSLLENAPSPTSPPLIGAQECDGSLEFCLGNLNRELSEEATDRLKKWVSRHDATQNTALLAAWAVLVAEHAAQDDVRFGSVFSLRSPAYAHAASAVAMCFSVLPFIVRGARHRPADELLMAVRDQEREARIHSASLDGSAAVRRQLGHPSTQSLIFFDDADVDKFLNDAHPGWNHRRFSLYGRNPYAIAMRGFGGKQMRIQAWYNPKSYSHSVVNCLLDQLVRVLELLPTKKNQPIEAEDLLPAEHGRLLRLWEAGPVREYRALPLHHLVSEQVQRSPASVAIVGDSRSLTYEQLDKEANRLAHLLAKTGFRSGATAAVCMARAPEAIIAVLAILKAGGAYVPIDASWPPSRVAGVMRQLQTCVVITDQCRAVCLNAAAAEMETSITVIQLGGTRDAELPGRIRWFGHDDLAGCMTEALSVAVTADDRAYVIFTSGSTGIPKGVVVQHGPVCNLIDWARRAFGFGPQDRVLWVTSLGFDLSVFDIFGILACGGSIRVASDEDIQSPERVLELLTTERITFWNSAPQALERLRHYLDLQQLPANADTTCLRLVFLSGDWIPLTLPAVIRRHFRNAHVISLGGATEATVWSNVFPVAVVEPGWRSIPYGRPMQNARYYILDPQQRRCGVGIPGELFIGGDVLAMGYCGDCELTKYRFPADATRPSVPARMYRTGDSARWWPDGNLELLGRLDDQVKVRGYRIELGEIEHTLRSHPGVRDAVVVARRKDSGENLLVAYVVCGESAVSYGSLRRHLHRTLPDYMVPAVFATIAALPQTPNGKVDRRALPNTLELPILRERPHIPPQSPREIVLARIFGQVLGLADVSAGDNFFELGGDSLSALGVVFAAEQVGMHITMDVLRNATIATLATDYSPMVTLPSAGEVAVNDCFFLTPNQQWLLDRSFGNPASYAFSAWLRIPEPIDADSLSLAWQATVDHHEALRIVFHNTGMEVLQSVQPVGSPAHVQHVDLRRCPLEQLNSELQTQAQAISRRAVLFDAMLPQLLFLRMPDEKDLLFLFIPHIITDEYSARIVIEDLGNSYLAAKKGRPVVLPATTLSFSQWATHLAACAGDQDLSREVDRFCLLPWQDVSSVPRDFPGGANEYSQAMDMRVGLSSLETQQLHQTCRSLRLSLASLLTAALVNSVAEWAGVETVMLDVTSAGRDPIFGSAPMHRSVGYFSTIHPVILKRSPGPLDAAAIHDMHCRLQSAPLRGALHGVGRYLHPESSIRRRLAELPRPEIKLNYHGLPPLCSRSSPFQPAGIFVPHTLGPTDKRQYLLNLEIMHYEGCLVTAWKYPGAICRHQTTERLVEKYLEHLRCCCRLPGRVFAGDSDAQFSCSQGAE